jgi:hypothetical protein
MQIHDSNRDLSVPLRCPSTAPILAPPATRNVLSKDNARALEIIAAGQNSLDKEAGPSQVLIIRVFGTVSSGRRLWPMNTLVQVERGPTHGFIVHSPHVSESELPTHSVGASAGPRADRAVRSLRIELPGALRQCGSTSPSRRGTGGWCQARQILTSASSIPLIVDPVNRQSRIACLLHRAAAPMGLVLIQSRQPRANRAVLSFPGRSGAVTGGRVLATMQPPVYC